MPKTPARTIVLIVSASIATAAAIFLFRGRDSIVEEFLFTADISNVVRSRSFLGGSESLTFTLSNHPFSLKAITGRYIKIAEDSGWRVVNGGGPGFNDTKHEIRANKNGQSLVINLEKPTIDVVIVMINHDK